MTASMVTQKALGATPWPQSARASATQRDHHLRRFLLSKK
jgi:hypothetical protein